MLDVWTLRVGCVSPMTHGVVSFLYPEYGNAWGPEFLHSLVYVCLLAYQEETL